LEISAVIKKIGYRIKKIRINKEYTLANMAEELEMTPSAYRKIEQGITNPPTTRLIEIAKVLEVNVADFFNEVDMVTEHSEKFGYATKDDIENVMRAVQQLARDFEKLREELPVKKQGAKKYAKPKRAKK
jgi:transcriptional regulator with XRE-family HTH domain